VTIREIQYPFCLGLWFIGTVDVGASVGFVGFWVMVASGVVVGWPLRVASRSWWMVRVVSCTCTVYVRVSIITLKAWRMVVPGSKDG